MTVLVTGGTGFIGAEIARSLRGKDTRVVVFDINPSRRRLDEIANDVEIVQGDLANFSHVLDAVRNARPDTIYHLGGMLSQPSERDPQAALRANALGTFHILEAARLFAARQVLFASTIATYGSDIREPTLGDATLQRPLLFYGITKVFGEHLGRYYRRRYGLDFRGIRYPSIVGPGVRTPGVVQFTSWAIESSVKGEPFTIRAAPRTAVPVLYYKDAARAMIELGQAPAAQVETVVYLLAGVTPTPTAQQLADAIRARIPGARITFEHDPALQSVLDGFARPIDDGSARREWGWRPGFTQEQIVDDFLHELQAHPERYA
jgi:threonine 3-dehydrogenase